MADKDPVTFSPDSALRIANVVRKIEREGGFKDTKTLWLGADKTLLPIVKVTGNATGGGIYNGQLVKAAENDLDTSTGLTEAGVGEAHAVAEDYSVLVENMAEIGASGHRIAENTLLPCVFRRFQDDGKTIVVAVYHQPILRTGTVSSISALCDDGSIAVDDDGGLTWNVHTTYPPHPVNHHHISVSDEIAFFALPTTEPGDPQGVAVAAPIGGWQLIEGLTGGSTQWAVTGDVAALKVINEHGEWKDFDFDNEVVDDLDEACTQEDQLRMEWRGSGLLNWEDGLLDQIRIWDFGSQEERPTSDGALCVYFDTGRYDDIYGRITARVPALRVDPFNTENLSISGNGCSMPAVAEPYIRHTTAGAIAQSIVVPITFERDGCDLKITPPTINLDENGHFVSFTASSPGNAVIATLPVVTKTFVTEVSTDGCDVNGNTDTIKGLDC